MRLAYILTEMHGRVDGGSEESKAVRQIVTLLPCRY
jgi:hypothetical protein